MASFLLLECLEKIFLNLLDNIYEFRTDSFYVNKSTKDLHSCTLVSKHWCRISTPLLYAYPFANYCRNAADLAFSYSKLIRTLISCTPKSEIEQLILSESSNPTFNYITFIRSLNFDLDILDELNCFKELWLPPFVLNNIKKDQIPKLSHLIINQLAKSLCENCNNNLTRLDFTFTNKNNNIKFLNSIIEPLTFNYCDEKNKLTNLKELYYNNHHDNKIDIYSTFSNHIHNLNLLHNEGNNSIEKANSLSRFISLQKKLKHLILSENSMYNDHGDYYNIVFESLPTQNENLQILNLRSIPFDKINEKALNSLCLLKNIKELRLHYCIADMNNLIPWAKDLKGLEVFEFLSYYDIGFENLVNQIIRSSSATLKKLIIDYHRKNKQDYKSLYQQIPIHLKSLIYLDLPEICPDELILIFKLCTRLVYLGIMLSNDASWRTKIKNLGESIPKNLRKIQFKDRFVSIFKVNHLKCFFEECLKNDSELKYLEIIDNSEIDQKYHDIANKFGIKLIYIQRIPYR
ncbi:hypothetical protein RclHR1_00080037 [Rhizophagus clarus]|uniref:Uncharacterized protein n=1 Tax=Rhizophagus clarus TaxID=94130 RepID=A0A2Z6SE05_9GLOM|nr:hypothetical protein RclHR1_00080037 [Rhizophagus clarus]GES89939.1 hypothetical protein GLOIN_2v1717599 [Rhizophagus clarus]